MNGGMRVAAYEKSKSVKLKSISTMTEGTIWRQIFLFSIPLILGNLLQQMYNTVDSIIVGNFVGSNALAAVGSSTSLICLLIAFSMGASAGAGVIVSQFYGAGDENGVQRSAHTALMLALILGIVLTIAGIVFSPAILRWMRTPEEVMNQSVLYLRIYSYGLVFNVIYNMAAGILNAVGNSRRSLMYLAVASFSNIFLDLWLIGGMHMGVEGAAIATDISQVGLPTAIQNTVISFSNVLVQSGVNGFGASAMAGFGAYLKVDGFNILPVMSFSMAATTFTGQNYGAGKTDRIRKGLRVTLGMSVLYTIVTGILLLTFSRPIIGIFSSDKEVIYYGAQAMKYFCPFYFLLGIMHSLAGTIRGTGKTVPPMVVMLLALCLLRILWIQFVVPHFTSIDIIYVLYPVSWAVGMVLMLIYAWKGNWMSKKYQNINQTV